MIVILKEDIPNLGFKDEIVTVKDGYGRNFLIPRGMAVIASESAKKVLAEDQRQRAHKLAKIKEEAETLAKRMEGTTLTLRTKTSNAGTIFGSVNNVQIADELEALGFDVNRKMIQLPGSIKEVGNYIAKVRLHKDVTVEVPFTVVSEDASDEEVEAVAKGETLATDNEPAEEADKEPENTEADQPEESTEDTEETEA